MTVAYATEAALTAFLPASVASVPDAGRLLERASELLDDKVRRGFAVDDGTQLPTDTAIASALEQACCAQVEFWLDVGEEHDVEGLHHRQVSIGHLSMSSLPPELAPRAQRILHLSGLLTSSGIGTTTGAFFATQGGV